MHEEPINQVLDLLKENPKALYNIGVGQLPHNEAEQFKERFPDIEIYGLEPQMNSFMQRKNQYCGELYPWGLWSSQSIQKMYVTKDMGNSSLLEPILEKISKQVISEEWISCITLDQFDEICGKSNDIFLWMDVEGAEFESLKGGTNLLRSGRVKWIDIEVSHKPRRKDDVYVNAITEYLIGLGYTLIKKYGKCRNHHNRLFERTK